MVWLVTILVFKSLQVKSKKEFCWINYFSFWLCNIVLQVILVCIYYIILYMCC